MKQQEFRKLSQDRIIVFDGATGTELSKRGMPTGVSPELWVLENPDILVQLQKEYVAAGTDILIAATFGANRFKLEEYGANDVPRTNRELIALSKRASGPDTLVFGDLAPTGQFVEPFGDVAFDTAVDVYKEQVNAFIEAGADGIMIETMMDLQETRAALIACRELTDLPVVVSMTFDEGGRTLNGTDPQSAAITLESLGATVVGCNCSTGPEKMTAVITQMREVATIPLYAKPNAGVPQLVDGKTVFQMKPDEFADKTTDLIHSGAGVIGGCCGTTPDHIRAVVQTIEGLAPPNVPDKTVSAVCSSRQPYIFGSKRCGIIGERINPTGKKKLQEELRKGDLSIVRRFALEQKNRGADILDVNMGLSGIDEREMMKKAVSMLSKTSPLPLCIDSTIPEVVETALRLYPGRALLNSISAEHERIDKILPIAAKYGAMFIILPVTDDGIPETVDERKDTITYVLEKASAYGYTKADACVDGLVMTISSDQQAARTTLDLIEWCSTQPGIHALCGLSNVSFGLPQRGWINAAFLSLAVSRGLSCAIASPDSQQIMSLINTVNEQGGSQ